VRPRKDLLNLIAHERDGNGPPRLCPWCARGRMDSMAYEDFVDARGRIWMDGS
jgi:hypothetical protein